MKKIINTNIGSIDSSKITTVYRTGNIVELITPYYRNECLKKIRKLSRTHYVVLETGEVKEYKQSINKSNNTQNVQRSLASLRRIINLNFTGDDSERFLTLTYATLMTDTSKLYKDFKSFISKLRKQYPVEYIVVAEPQQSGSWHLHVLLKSMTIKRLHLPIKILSEMWIHGNFHIEKLPFAENFGAYFAVRVTDLYSDDSDINKANAPKSVIKGGRLHFYPPNFKIYRCSKGIKRPLPTKMSYGEARKLTDGMELCYSCSKQIISVDEYGNEKTLNSICYQQFKNNLRRDSDDSKNFNLR